MRESACGPGGTSSYFFRCNIVDLVSCSHATKSSFKKRNRSTRAGFFPIASKWTKIVLPSSWSKAIEAGSLSLTPPNVKAKVPASKSIVQYTSVDVVSSIQIPFSLSFQTGAGVATNTVGVAGAGVATNTVGVAGTGVGTTGVAVQPTQSTAATTTNIQRFKTYPLCLIPLRHMPTEMTPTVRMSMYSPRRGESKLRARWPNCWCYPRKPTDTSFPSVAYQVALHTR